MPANSNAIEKIPEETHDESQSAESQAAPPASGVQQTETKIDKYENVRGQKISDYGASYSFRISSALTNVTFVCYRSCSFAIVHAATD